MAGVTWEPVLQALRGERCVAIVRAASAEAAGEAMEAAVRGGVRIVEFTMNTPGAVDLVADFARRPGLVAGAGTVLDRAQARAAVAAGARFLVSPVLDEEVLHEADALGVPLLPGCSTPTEMWRAHRMGCAVQKLFPAPAGGPAFVRSLLGPMPFLQLVPTSGVDETNVRPYLDAGVLAVGLGGGLFLADDLAGHRWDAIEARAARLRALVAAVR